MEFLLDVVVRAYTTGRAQWTQSLDGIPDGESEEAIDNNGGDSPDDQKVLVSLQPPPERIIWIFSSLIGFGVSNY